MIKATIAIAMGPIARGCLVSIESDTDGRFTVDIAEGYDIDEIFYEGSKLPKIAGIYTFTGEAVNGFDQIQYTGVFDLIKGKK